MKKLSIPYTKDNRLFDILTDNELQYIKEIYMPLPYDIMPSGRHYMSFEQDQYKQIFDMQLSKAKALGLRVNLLASKPIMNVESSVSLMTKTYRELDRIKSLMDKPKVTIGSMTFLKLYGRQITDLGYSIELSVLSAIDCYEKVKYIMAAHPYVKSICLANNLINDITQLRYIKTQYPNLELKVLVNHSCLYKCPSHVEHHDISCNILTSIEAVDTTNIDEWRSTVNMNQLTPNCKICVFYTQNQPINPVKDTAFIRPEDLHLYDDIIDLYKISGREHPSNRVLMYIQTYGERSYKGLFSDLMDIPMRVMTVIDNNAIPSNFGEVKSKCEHKCYKCGYCDTIISENHILIDIAQAYANNPQ